MSWIELLAFQRVEDGGRLLSASISEHIEIHVESGPHQRDVRVVDDDTIVKIQISADWELEAVLVNDRYVWQKGDAGPYEEGAGQSQYD